MDIIWDDEIKKEPQIVPKEITSTATMEPQPVNTPNIIWDDEITNPNPQLTGEIMTPKTFKKDVRKKYNESGQRAENIGQVVGGIAGSVGGGALGHPYIGGAIGGTLGRATGGLMHEQAEQVRDIGLKRKAGQKLTPRERAVLFLAPPFSAPFVLSGMEKPEKKQLVKTIATAAVTESIAAPVSLGLSVAGRGILKGILGARVAQRGFERGFKTILDPKFYKERVPKEIAKKTSKFFSNLSRVTGEGVEEVINSSKYQNKIVWVGDLKKRINNILPKGITINDLEGTPAQKKLLQRATNLVNKLGETQGDLTEKQIIKSFSESREISITKLWKLRRKLDTLINSHNFSKDSLDYLNNLRNILNEPIRSSGDDVAAAFNRYKFVKDGEWGLGKYFEATTVGKGVVGKESEIYASNAERFAADLMKTPKDDLIRQLKDLDKLANSSDKVIEDFLDFAAAESLDKPIGFGVIQETILGIFGGRKGIAEIGRIAQSPISKSLRVGASRGIPTALTDLYSKEQD